jgi:hypothetical protein
MAGATAVAETSDRVARGAAYFADRLFRSGNPSGPDAGTAARAEAGRIMVRAL